MEVKSRIHRLRERIRYAAVPMEELFAEFGVVPSTTAAPEFEREEWERCVSEWGESVGLSADDKTVLEGFAQGFGRLDVEGEIRFCEEYQEVFSERLEHAREAVRTKGRVWLTLGVCGGLTVGLLFL